MISVQQIYTNERFKNDSVVQIKKLVTNVLPICCLRKIDLMQKKD